MYSIGILSIILSQGIVLLTPLVIRTTIDSIIGQIIIENQNVLYFVNRLGGRMFLKENLWIIGLLIIFFTILRGVFLYLKNTMSSKSAENIAENIKNQLYDHIQKLPYEYHVSAETGDLIQRGTSDVDTIRRFLTIQLMEVVGSFFMLIFTI